MSQVAQQTRGCVGSWCLARLRQPLDPLAVLAQGGCGAEVISREPPPPFTVRCSHGGVAPEILDRPKETQSVTGFDHCPRAGCRHQLSGTAPRVRSGCYWTTRGEIARELAGHAHLEDSGLLMKNQDVRCGECLLEFTVGEWVDDRQLIHASCQLADAIALGPVAHQHDSNPAPRCVRLGGDVDQAIQALLHAHVAGVQSDDLVVPPTKARANSRPVDADGDRDVRPVGDGLDAVWLHPSSYQAAAEDLVDDHNAVCPLQELALEPPGGPGEQAAAHAGLRQRRTVKILHDDPYGMSSKPARDKSRNHGEQGRADGDHDIRSGPQQPTADLQREHGLHQDPAEPAAGCRYRVLHAQQSDAAIDPLLLLVGESWVEHPTRVVGVADDGCRAEPLRRQMTSKCCRVGRDTGVFRGVVQAQQQDARMARCVHVRIPTEGEDFKFVTRAPISLAEIGDRPELTADTSDERARGRARRALKRSAARVAPVVGDELQPRPRCTQTGWCVTSPSAQA
ncbi:hypothetical protein SAMN05660199_04621 [Klenkia soli]|uniref:Uncharacterized protein n=1 Tax=Klenkia soli TaxID=1052260 RepID=A0A1H0UTG7_9ACTN|nr:hypothetical protein SAMN05660199_04621 [Klenkia soli]